MIRRLLLLLLFALGGAEDAKGSPIWKSPPLNRAGKVVNAWIGVLLRVHGAAQSYTSCTAESNPMDVAALEAVKFFDLQLQRKKANEDAGLVFGFEVYDTCDNPMKAIEATASFIRSSKHQKCTQIDLSQMNDTIVALSGTVFSTSTMSITTVMQYYCVPFISALATSPALSRTQLFPYFGRMVANDTYQASALVALLGKLNIASAVVVYETSDYGIGLWTELSAQLQKKDFCFAKQFGVNELDELSNVTWERVIDHVESAVSLSEGDTKPPGAVILILSYSMGRQFFLQLNTSTSCKKALHDNNIQLISSDGIAQNSFVTKDLETVVNGLISTDFAIEAISEFDTHIFENLTLDWNNSNSNINAVYGPSKAQMALIALSNDCLWNVSSKTYGVAGKRPCQGSESLARGVASLGVAKAPFLLSALEAAVALVRQAADHATLNASSIRRHLLKLNASSIFHPNQQIQFFDGNSGRPEYNYTQFTCPACTDTHNYTTLNNWTTIGVFEFFKKEVNLTL